MKLRRVCPDQIRQQEESTSQEPFCIVSFLSALVKTLQLTRKFENRCPHFFLVKIAGQRYANMSPIVHISRGR